MGASWFDWLRVPGRRGRPGRTTEPGLVSIGGQVLRLKMVHVPPGQFWMGGAKGVCGKKLVTVAGSFHIGVYPVTQGEWWAVTGGSPSYFSRTGGGAKQVESVPDADLESFPVEQVAWPDVAHFFDRLNGAAAGSGWTYRLPTSEEWEFALRSPVPTPASADSCREWCGFSYYFDRPSNDMSSADANVDGTGERPPGVYLRRTSKVGSYRPNALGLYDLHGNVDEWTGTWHGKPGDPGSRVECRKGSWGAGATQSAANETSLGRVGFGIHGSDSGFRVVCVPSAT